MAQSIGAKQLAEYKFTHEEMARLLGISSNALRMRMRNGNHDEFEMSYINGKKMYKRPRDYLGIRPPGRWAGHTPKQQKTFFRGPSSGKKVKRGNHFDADYPNHAFKTNNEVKMMARLKGSLDQETTNLIPAAIKIAKSNRRKNNAIDLERLREESRRARARTVNWINESNSGYGSVQYHSPNAHLIEPRKFEGSKGKETKSYEKKYYW
mgnify:FL=1